MKTVLAFILLTMSQRLVVRAARKSAGLLSPVQKQQEGRGRACYSTVGQTECVILLRHGESVWNLKSNERFTGWCDVPVTRRGEAQAIAAGKILKERGLQVEVACTSLLQRASRTMELALASCASQDGCEIMRSWRLNERHYGELCGLDKLQTAREMDPLLVHEWRRSWEVPPPQMLPSHPLYDSIYSHPIYQNLDLPIDQLPRGESVAQCAARLEPYWFSHIVPAIRSGKTTLVVAHANSLRALLRIIFRRQVTDEQIRAVKIPTGVPLIYHLTEVPIHDLDSTLPRGLTEHPQYDFIPLPPPPGSKHLTNDILWPLQEAPIIYEDWSLDLSVSELKGLSPYDSPPLQQEQQLKNTNLKQSIGVNSGSSRSHSNPS